MSENTSFAGNLQETHLVQKSEPLLLMKTVPFDLGELKILDTYLSRINSHDPNNHTVTFTKAEYEQLMGLEKCNLNSLKKHTKSMLGKVVELPMPDGYAQFTLFTKAVCKLDKYNQRIIELSCSEEAKKVFFNIEKLGYLQYELKNILSLSSKYSFLLYLYLRKERYRADWVISLQKLRDEIFDIKGNEYYINFKYFKRDILDKALKEINKKTDISFEYKTEKTGRRVTGIRFILVKENVLDADVNQLSLDDLSEEQNEKEINYGSELANLIGESACNDEFSLEQVRVIQDLVIKIIPENDNLKRCDYVIEKMHLMNYYSSRNPIPNRFEYLKKMISNEIKK